MIKTGKLLSASPVSGVDVEEFKQQTRMFKVLNGIWIIFSKMWSMQFILKLFRFSLGIFRLNWPLERPTLELPLHSSLGNWFVWAASLCIFHSRLKQILCLLLGIQFSFLGIGPRHTEHTGELITVCKWQCFIAC